MNDYGRYKRTRQSPQVAEVPTTLQPARTMEQIPIIHSDNVQQLSKVTGSELEAETWSFHRTRNEVFRLLPQELRPKTTEKNYYENTVRNWALNGVSRYSIISSSAVKTSGKYHKVYTE